MEMQNWNAVWIENTDCPGETAPIFIKEFTVGDVRQAELRICGLGFYVAELNGRRVGDAIPDRKIACGALGAVPESRDRDIVVFHGSEVTGGTGATRGTAPGPLR